MPAPDDLALLTDAARAAGDIAMRFWRNAPEVWDKGNGAGPVTEADLAVNRMLEADLRAARPDYGWLSEESPDDATRLQTGRQFIIDPIDGTRAFVDGSTDFAHSLAVADEGRITAAVVFLPARNSLYSASNDEIARLNGAPIRCSAAANPQDATLLTARPNLAPEHWRDDQPPAVRRMVRSSIAWRLCLVADGTFDAMMTLRPTWEWDAAAGALIAARAGARVTDRRGQDPAFNRPAPLLDGCLAAPPGLHDALRARLRD